VSSCPCARYAHSYLKATIGSISLRSLTERCAKLTTNVAARLALMI
jgi:hypothetical protein